MEELLKEVALSERKKQQIDLFVQKVTKLLQNVPETPKVEVCNNLTAVSFHSRFIKRKRKKSPQ